MITIWKSAFFEGHLAFHNSFSLTVDIRSLHNNAKWLLTNIYGPCTDDGKQSFVEWMKNIVMPEEIDWLMVGYFNLMRSPDNRSKPGGDVTHMLMFNEGISALGLVELPLLGQQFTLSNKQFEPLLERLDWFFTSNSWTFSYPHTTVSSMLMEISDHTPCVVNNSTNIPKGKIFCFENYWMEHEVFMDVVCHGWSIPTMQTDAAKIISAKFKNLRRVLRVWQAQLPV